MAEIPKAYEPKSVEDRLYAEWLNDGCFAGIPREAADTYTIQLNYTWPGNIRELENEIERTLILSRGQPTHLTAPVDSPARQIAARPDADRIIPEAEWKTLQRENIIRALRKSRGRVDGPEGAAEQLGLRHTTLRSRMEAMKISKSEIFR